MVIETISAIWSEFLDYYKAICWENRGLKLESGPLIKVDVIVKGKIAY